MKKAYKDKYIGLDFFKQSEEVADYFSIKCPHFNYKHLPREDVVKSGIIQNRVKIFLDCIKQHLIVFTPNDPVDDDFGDINDDDDNDEVDRTEQIFNFVVVPSFVSLFSGSPNEPLYFLRVTEKGTASENHSDLYGHFLSAGNCKRVLFKVALFKKC